MYDKALDRYVQTTPSSRQMTLRNVLMEVVLDVRYFNVFAILIVAAQFEDERLNVSRDLLL